MPEGTSGISVGTPVLVIAENKDDVPAFAAFTAADAGAAPKAAAPKAEAAPAQPAAAPTAPAAAAPAAAPRPAVQAAAPGGRVIASPYARRLAAEAGVSLAGAPGSGPGGRIVAADVQQLIASGGAAQAAAGAAVPEGAYAYAAYTDVPNSQIRKVRVVCAVCYAVCCAAAGGRTALAKRCSLSAFPEFRSATRFAQPHSYLSALLHPALPFSFRPSHHRSLRGG